MADALAILLLVLFIAVALGTVLVPSKERRDARKRNPKP